MSRALPLLVLALLSGAACRSTPPKPSLAESSPPSSSEGPSRPAVSAEPAKPSISCAPSVIDLERWMSDGLLVFGELHGTQEIPQLIAQTVCAVSASAKTTWLTMEIPDDEQPRIDAFLDTGDEAPLLEGPFWRRDYQDGRSSQGMLRLLREARRLRAARRDVRVLAMDKPSTGGNPDEDRDTHMAAVVARARTRAPAEPMVLLVGNIHATRRLKIPRSLVWRLVKQGVGLKTLLIETSGGAGWMCGSSCGPAPLSGEDLGPDWRVVESPKTVDAGYDALMYLGVVTPSPPAWKKP